ncbi:hypothetical protein WDW37_10060 [Bdellovibrionota bacterium FG-1]
MKWVVALLSGFGGLLVFVTGVFLGLERYHLYRTGIHTKGKVVEQHREVSTPENLDVIAPEQSFQGKKIALQIINEEDPDGFFLAGFA